MECDPHESTVREWIYPDKRYNYENVRTNTPKQRRVVTVTYTAGSCLYSLEKMKTKTTGKTSRSVLGSRLYGGALGVGRRDVGVMRRRDA